MKKTAMFIWKLVIIMGHFHIPSQYVKNTILAYNSLEKLVKYFYKTTREVFLCQKNAHTFNYMQPNNWKHIAGLHSATSNKKHLLSSWRKALILTWNDWVKAASILCRRGKKNTYVILFDGTTADVVINQENILISTTNSIKLFLIQIRPSVGIIQRRGESENTLKQESLS